MGRSDCFVWGGLLAVLGGCGGEAPVAEKGWTPPPNGSLQGKGGNDGGSGEAGDAAEALAEAGGLEPTQAFPSTGWLDKEGSALYPWCAAVLVAPRVVLTGASCARSDIHTLRFGVGAPGGRGVPVVDSLQLPGDSRVAALVLAEALEGVEPAELAVSGEDDADMQEGAAVRGVSMLYAERGHASHRWVWPGILHTDEELSVEIGATEDEPGAGEGDEETRPPSCHGDNGTGVYTDAGLLAGIVVAARGDQICADRFVLSPLAARALVDEALTGLGVAPTDERPDVLVQ